MLSRLMKHEWKETWRIPCLSCIIVILSTLLSAICFSRMEVPQGDDALNVGAFFFIMGFCLLLSCISMVASLYIAVRFYRNLYTDEGYLMHTLPVTPRELILSKLLIGAFWMFVLSLLITWAILVAFAFCMPVLSSEPVHIDLAWFSANSHALFGMNLPAFGIVCLVLYVTSSFSGVLIYYGAISLGQLFSKHKVMGAVLCYIGFTMLIQTVMSFAMIPGMAQLVITTDVTNDSAVVPATFGIFFSSIFIISIAGSIIFGVISYILTEYIMKKQLNLD